MSEATYSARPLNLGLDIVRAYEEGTRKGQTPRIEWPYCGWLDLAGNLHTVKSWKRARSIWLDRTGNHYQRKHR